MAVARWLETDSLTNQSIASATAIGAYTADADRMIVCDVSIDQAAGGGDYVVYVTRQIGGAGSAYVLLPKTTCTAAAGETAIAMQSGQITVRSGDVLTVYVDGLAGDTTTPDTTVRWFEMATLRPATADRTLTVAATGEALVDQAGIWSYTSRTLTATPAQTTDGTAASAITRKRGDSWSISITLGALTGYTSLWLTLKRSTNDADTDSVLQVRKNASGLTDGLLYVNGTTASNAALASITIDNLATGAVTIAVDKTVTDDIAPAVYDYDAQVLTGDAVSTPDSGAFTVTADVTRSVA